MPKDSLEIIGMNLDFAKKCECPETRAKVIQSALDHLQVLAAQIKRLSKENEGHRAKYRKIIEILNNQMTMALESDDSD